MADRKSTQLRGHGLQAEGKAHMPTGGNPPWMRVRGHIGRGLCKCGAVSDVEWTDADRRRWHVAHKAQERQRGETSD